MKLRNSIFITYFAYFAPYPSTNHPLISTINIRHCVLQGTEILTIPIRHCVEVFLIERTSKETWLNLGWLGWPDTCQLRHRDLASSPPSRNPQFSSCGMCARSTGILAWGFICIRLITGTNGRIRTTNIFVEQCSTQPHKYCTKLLYNFDAKRG